MRLTLRTLLAYLDDTLEPSQARLIGQKVAESEPAQELVGRIKQVTRRRRLTTPPVSGPGPKLDPNTIAEYVDNVLTAEQLAEVEETCLQSDVHLAEVAACHQILTLVLGEPMLVPPTARQRMYALKQGRESKRKRQTAAPGIGQGSLDAPGAGDDADEGSLLGISLGRQGSWLRLFVPIAAVCLLVAAALAILKAIPVRSTQVAAGQPGLPENKQPGVTQPDELGKAKQSAEQPANNAEAQAKAANQPDAKTTPDPKKEPPPDGKAETVKKPETTAEPAKEEKASAPAKPLPPRTERRELGKYVLTTPGILLDRDPEKGLWQRIRPEGLIHSTDLLVSLPGYRSELRLDSGARLILWGNVPEFYRLPFPITLMESAVILHHNPPFELDFTLDHGRVVLANARKQGPVRVRVRFADEVWDVTLPDQASEVTLELTGRCAPYVRDMIGGEPETYVALWSLKGECQLKDRFEEFRLFSPSQVVWDNIRRREGPQKLERPPELWAANVSAKSPMNLALDGLAKRLVNKDSLDVAIAEMMKDSDPAGHTLALRCLGAMGDLSNLCDALTNERSLELPVNARLVLLHYLGLSANNDEKLLKMLRQKNYADSHAQTIMQLLHGYSEEQWANPTVRAVVVEYLNNDRLAIRYLTHMLLLEKAPEGVNIPYRPEGDAGQRQRGTDEWRKLLLMNKPPARPDNGKKKGQ